MSEIVPSEQDVPSQQRESIGSIVGLCAVSASTLIVEIALTKFLSFKLFHHLTFAILSLVILNFGTAGILSFSSPGLFGLKPGKIWSQLGLFAMLYAIAIGVAVPLFCWCPLNPYDSSFGAVLQLLSTPLIFGLLAIPFFLAGICVSQTLAVSTRKVTIVYFWDLLAAAIGALSCPLLLSGLGGYGTMALASILGMIGAFGYWQCGQVKLAGKVPLLAVGIVSVGACLAYPHWAISKYGIDILTFKEIGPIVVLRDFKGIADTSWNAVARVDVSHTGTSKAPTFLCGFAPITDKLNIFGRYILLDGGANTRQFQAKGDVHEQEWLSQTLAAAPYIVKPDAKNVLVIGGGGGIDILTGKYFKAPNLTVVEINPSIFKILNGKYDDADGSYTRWLKPDQTTNIRLVNDEARHFATIQPPAAYDVLQSSGVDTLTAIQTGGMSLTENYLYTLDAMGDYTKLLKPDGLLALTHWRTAKPGTAFRMFLTYLQYLDSQGVKNPEKHVVVLGTNLTVALLKRSEFSPEELQRIRDWAGKCHIDILFDPERKTGAINPDYPGDEWYNKVAFVTADERRHMIDTINVLPPPVTDDKPYFYSFRHNTDYWVTANQDSLPTSLIVMTLVFGLGCLILPLFNIGKFKMSSKILWAAFYFSLTGFAFLLYETAIIQLFSIFVGGPLYSLSVVLVSVLGGYAGGSWLASKIQPKPAFFYAGALGLSVIMAGLYLLVPVLVKELFMLPLSWRLVCCSLLTAFGSAAIGVPVSSAMGFVRERYAGVVSWMWGVSSVANALGAVSFITITKMLGISSCLLIAAACYLLGNFLFAAFVTDKSAS